MPALYRALTPVEVEEIIVSSETQMELMKRYQVAQSTISNIKASRAALAQVYNEINLTDVLDEVSALVKRGGASIIVALITVAARRNLDVETVGVMVRKNAAFKKFVEAEALSVHALKPD